MARGVGKTQQLILKVLEEDERSGLSVEQIAREARLSRNRVRLAVGRLAERGIVILTSAGFFVWLPRRRLAWLEVQMPKTDEVIAEINQLKASALAAHD